MDATIIARTPTSFTLQVEVPYNDSMLAFEETLQQCLNEAGVVATAEGLKQFDTDGSPISVGSTKLTTKGQVEKDYQTPYGVATVARHVYQGTQGGPTYCPLDRDARIVVSSTPRFAKVLSHKYAEFSSPRAQVDLQENHGRAVSRCLIQDVADAVAAAVLAKEEDWSYTLPKFEEPPATVAISLDGTCLLMGEDGWRETMVGTLSFYDREGERQHTVYLAATPEYGKAKFLNRLEAEVRRAKEKCPGAHYVGIADGAKGNWEFLERHTEVQVTDFWHAAEYLGKAAAVLYRGQPQTRKAWLDEACHRLKHDAGGAVWVLKRLRSLSRQRPWAQSDEDVQRAITYFANQSAAGRMDYAARVAAGEPIGSGVTEAACKVIVKQRLCGSGMKWTEDGAAVVLSLRALSYTPERWEQFWAKVNRWGFPVAA
ncbi:MAG: ISKra4 family transposase [Planctomycetaceae bacterium]|nr:ISKra4 family transposase [Planctomycetaceae bacterium]MBV8384896.1 ISKra4 family transposase [Planctomycetaceae bacterium]